MTEDIPIHTPQYIQYIDPKCKFIVVDDIVCNVIKAYDVVDRESDDPEDIVKIGVIFPNSDEISYLISLVGFEHTAIRFH